MFLKRNKKKKKTTRWAASPYLGKKAERMNVWIVGPNRWPRGNLGTQRYLLRVYDWWKTSKWPWVRSRVWEFNWPRFQIEQGQEVRPERIWRGKKQPRILCRSSNYLGSQFLAVVFFWQKFAIFRKRKFSIFEICKFGQIWPKFLFSG